MTLLYHSFTLRLPLKRIQNLLLFAFFINPSTKSDIYHHRIFMKLAIFDLDHTLLAGDSDYAWGNFLVDQGVVDAEASIPDRQSDVHRLFPYRKALISQEWTQSSGRHYGIKVYDT